MDSLLKVKLFCWFMYESYDSIKHEILEPLGINSNSS